MVPREGLEPSIRYRPRILSPVRIPFRHLGMEVQMGIEPMHRGFADRSVTTSPLHQLQYNLCMNFPYYIRNTPINQGK